MTPLEKSTQISSEARARAVKELESRTGLTDSEDDSEPED